MSRERVTEVTYEFTRVRQTETRADDGRWQITGRARVALRANPFWFPHDLFKPPSAADGGPFTIGRVIHSGRSVGTTGLIGGVAVYGRALSDTEMRRLASIGFEGRESSARRTDCHPGVTGPGLAANVVVASPAPPLTRRASPAVPMPLANRSGASWKGDRL